MRIGLIALVIVAIGCAKPEPVSNMEPEPAIQSKSDPSTWPTPREYYKTDEDWKRAKRGDPRTM
jgi:hypothetical protein